MASGFKTDRRLCLSRDKKRVVEASDKDAGWLFAPIGGQITEPRAAEYGLVYVDGKVVLPGSQAEPKAVKKPEDKSRKRGGDKGRTYRPPEKAHRVDAVRPRDED